MNLVTAGESQGQVSASAEHCSMLHWKFPAVPSSVSLLQLQREVRLSDFTMVTELVEKIGDAGLVSMGTDSEMTMLLPVIY